MPDRPTDIHLQCHCKKCQGAGVNIAEGRYERLQEFRKLECFGPRTYDGIVHRLVAGLSLHGEITRATRNLQHALDVSENIVFSEKEKEKLASSAARLRDLLGDAEVRTMAASGVDWDAEIAKLSEEDH
jgi:hypothetical protein